jgi:hypothetical protein
LAAAAGFFLENNISEDGTSTHVLLYRLTDLPQTLDCLKNLEESYLQNTGRRGSSSVPLVSFPFPFPKEGEGGRAGGVRREGEVFFPKGGEERGKGRGEEGGPP